MRDGRRQSRRRRAGRGRILLRQEVADRLRQDMQAGFHPRGTYLPSEANLCARFKVSRDTIRRALAILSEEGLIHAERGVGHRVSGHVVSAKQDRDDLVVVIAPCGKDALPFAQMVAGIERTLSSAGIRLVVSSMQVREQDEVQAVTAAQVEHVLHMRPHAVVCGLPPGTDASEVRRLVRADVHVVAVGEDPVGIPVDYVGTDDRLGAYMISKWLADWAGDLPWCVSGAAGFPGLDARLEGYSLALGNRCEDPGERPVCHLSSEDSAGLVAEVAEWAQERRSSGRLGVFCTRPDLVLPVAGGLEQAGIKVGEQAAIGCVGSVWRAGMPTGIPICTAGWSASDMGITAAHLVVMRGVRGDTRVPLRVLVAPRPVIAEEYVQPGVLSSYGQGTDERR